MSTSTQRTPRDKRRTVPELRGLVLAGGESRRMGRDKGTLEYHGEPQAEYAYRLLLRFMAHVAVSVRAEQTGRAPYDSLPVVIDAGGGPAAGLLAAWAAQPGAALCVLAVDLPRVDDAVIERLVAARDPAACATAFVHADGTPEPLCTIYEPAARAAMTEPAGGAGISLRAVLERSRVRAVRPPDPDCLVSVNAPADAARLGAAPQASGRRSRRPRARARKT